MESFIRFQTAFAQKIRIFGFFCFGSSFSTFRLFKRRLTLSTQHSIFNYCERNTPQTYASFVILPFVKKRTWKNFQKWIWFLNYTFPGSNVGTCDFRCDLGCDFPTILMAYVTGFCNNLCRPTAISLRFGSLLSLLMQFGREFLLRFINRFSKLKTACRLFFVGFPLFASTWFFSSKVMRKACLVLLERSFRLDFLRKSQVSSSMFDKNCLSNLQEIADSLHEWSLY